MTSQALRPPPAISAALAERASRGLPGVSSFTELEERAHAVLPELAALRHTVGATPLVAVPSRRGGGVVWLKVESANSTGTVKARTAYALLCAAVVRSGTPAVRLVEYSGGSLAVALAEFCAVLGLDLHIVVPDGAPERLCRSLRQSGALVSSGHVGMGFLGAMDQAVRVAEAEGRRLLLQHCAEEAVAMHREHTGTEVVDQLRRAEAEPVAFAAAVGSGGSLLGISQSLREVWPACRTLAVFPQESPYGDPAPPNSSRRMNGTGGIGHGLRQPLLAPHEADVEFHEVAYPEALRAMHELRSAHGVAVSSSGAGAWLRASDAVDTGPAGRCAVAVVASRGTPEEWIHATAGD